MSVSALDRLRCSSLQTTLLLTPFWTPVRGARNRIRLPRIHLQTTGRLQPAPPGSPPLISLWIVNTSPPFPSRWRQRRHTRPFCPISPSPSCHVTSINTNQRWRRTRFCRTLINVLRPPALFDVPGWIITNTGNKMGVGRSCDSNKIWHFIKGGKVAQRTGKKLRFSGGSENTLYCNEPSSYRCSLGQKRSYSNIH